MPRYSKDCGFLQAGTKAEIIKRKISKRISKNMQRYKINAIAFVKLY
jgi:hypothetical protein